jgi:murein DD-endopeptidase MepM/ murein hydrolase activator NlpD
MYAGILAGQPLHFERDTNDRCIALGAIPISASDSVTARVLRTNPGGLVDTLTATIPVRAGKYPIERLRVAPQFGSTPDSALKARTDREAAQALAIARQSHETPKLWQGAFVAPRPGRVTSGFGRAREFNGELQSRHMGTDFAGAEGAPVRASNRGVVALIGAFYYGGNVVYVDHGAGLVTGHMHLSTVSVAAGDTVERGQIIGRVGSTGRVTGPHLHWIVRYGEVSVDPLSLLTLTKAPPTRRP